MLLNSQHVMPDLPFGRQQLTMLLLPLELHKIIGCSGAITRASC